MCAKRKTNNGEGKIMTKDTELVFMMAFYFVILVLYLLSLDREMNARLERIEQYL